MISAVEIYLLGLIISAIIVLVGAVWSRHSLDRIIGLFFGVIILLKAFFMGTGIYEPGIARTGPALLVILFSLQFIVILTIWLKIKAGNRVGDQ